MPGLLNIGLSGIRANQLGLTTTGNNIANANVEGFSRQRLEVGTRPSQFLGSGFVGNGVDVQDITRVADQFLIDQLRVDTSRATASSLFRSNIEQVDSLLADSSTGLATTLDNFFAAVQTGVDDPANLPGRQTVLNAAESLASRFNLLYDRFTSQSSSVDTQLVSASREVTTLAQGVAALNQQIEQSLRQGNGSSPNDLIDRRDLLLKQLADKINISTTTESTGAINVFLGSGQALVVGGTANQLSTATNAGSNGLDVVLQQGTASLRISDEVTGGELGGLLGFRNEVLGQVFNELGRIAIVLGDAVNNTQQLGVDLEGNLGQSLFTEINSTAAATARVTADFNNAQPPDRELSVFIDDTARLSTSDYELNFVGPGDENYIVKRLSDDALVASGTISGGFPVSINEFDGLRIELEGGSFQQGDRFVIQPTRFASRDFDSVINRPQELAYGVPISTGSSLGNIGTGGISLGDILPNAAGTAIGVTSDGTIQPPLIIRFTSATTFDVLDNSDPNNPVALVPPLTNIPFVPGRANSLFAEDSGLTQVRSDSSGLQFASAVNGFPAETITITTTDAGSGISSPQSLAIDANTSARSAAQLLSGLEGVVARANTEVVLQVNDAGVGTNLLSLSLNGEDLTDPGLGAVPIPVTADFLRDRINDNANLQASGIFALSNGTDLTVRSTSGEDLSFAILNGDAGDTLNFTSSNGSADVGSLAVGDVATVGGVLEVDLAEGAVLESTVGRFAVAEPSALAAYRGFQAELTGIPQVGDEFFINAGTGISDNRNAFILADLQDERLASNGSASIAEVYSQLVSQLGARTNQAQISDQANSALLQQAQANRDSVSGVNLDEEAARLIQFEQAYNASAQIINVARQLFDTLLDAVG